SRSIRRGPQAIATRATGPTIARSPRMRFASFALFALIVTGCAATPGGDEAHVLDDTLDDTRSDAPPRGEILPLVLDHAAVVGTADRPNAVVYVPDGYDPS